MSSIKIVHLSSVHHRRDTRIFYKECISLSSIYDVSFIVADGKGDEIIEGIKVLDIGKPTSRLNRILKSTKLILKKALKIDADVYHFHDPELIPVGLKLKKMKKLVIYDTHEDVPRQLLAKPYLNSITKPIISNSFESFENYAANKFDGIITATPFIRDRFLKINANSIDINNFPILGELDNQIKWSDKENSVCYVGSITEIRGIKEIVKAFEFVETDVKFQLGGTFGKNSMRNEVIAYKGWKSVNELGFLNRLQIQDVLSKSFAGIVTLRPTINYLDSLPVKMFEYMLAEIPVIASDFPFWRKIVHDANCGLCVNPLNPKKIAEAIDTLNSNRKLAKLLGQNGKKAVLEKYNWSIEKVKLLKFYKNILNLIQIPRNV